MDYLRSGYTTSIYSFDPVSGVMIPTTIQWFKAPTGATPLGVRHQYGSANWQRGLPYPDQVGEVLTSPRPWSNGAAVAGYSGVNHCGADPLWTGRLERLTVAEPSNPDGSPGCCGSTCARCLNNAAPTSYTLTLTGGTNEFATWNGVWHLPYSGFCVWQLDIPGLPWRHWEATAQFAFGEIAIINKSATPNHTAAWHQAGTDCYHRSGGWVYQGGTFTGTPPSVSLSTP